MTPRELERFLHEQIPLTKALGIRVMAADDHVAEIHSPLKPNRNHLGTAFGGSLAAVMIVAGYTWIFHMLTSRGQKTHIVLQHTETEYLLPVEEDLRATCEAPSPAQFKKFLNTLEKKKRARLKLKVELRTKDGVACRLTGDFIALQSSRPQIG